MRGTAVKGSRRMFNCRPAAASAKSTKNSRCFYNFPFWHCSSCSDKQQPWTIATEGHINCFENGNKNVSNTNSALVETNKTYHWGRQLEMLWKSTGCPHTGLNLVPNSYIIYALKSESLKLSCLGFGAAVCTSTSQTVKHITRGQFRSLALHCLYNSITTQACKLCEQQALVHQELNSHFAHTIFVSNKPNVLDFANFSRQHWRVSELDDEYECTS